jgi:hypothetical protein
VECDTLAIDEQADASFKYNDHEVVFRPAWFRIHNVVCSIDFTGKDITLDISHTSDGFFAKKNGGLYTFLLHKCLTMDTNIGKLANRTKSIEE